MTGKPISRDVAEEAIRRRDWHTASDYWAALGEAEGPALEWLRVMEEAALPGARAGELAAQQVLGSIGIAQYLSGAPVTVEPLQRGLKWIVSALRQELSPSGLQMLIAWYGTLRGQGVHDADIETYLSEPEPREAWRQWTGKDPLA